MDGSFAAEAGIDDGMWYTPEAAEYVKELVLIEDDGDDYYDYTYEDDLGLIKVLCNISTTGVVITWRDLNGTIQLGPLPSPEYECVDALPSPSPSPVPQFEERIVQTMKDVRDTFVPLPTFPDMVLVDVGNSEDQPMHRCYRYNAPPPVAESCDVPCDFPYYSITQWSPCSTLCGGGVNTRSVTCMAGGGGGVLPDEECLGDYPLRPETPPSVKSCYHAECRYRARESAPSSCTALCDVPAALPMELFRQLPEVRQDPTNNTMRASVRILNEEPSVVITEQLSYIRRDDAASYVGEGSTWSQARTPSGSMSFWPGLSTAGAISLPSAPSTLQKVPHMFGINGPPAVGFTTAADYLDAAAFSYTHTKCIDDQGFRAAIAGACVQLGGSEGHLDRTGAVAPNMSQAWWAEDVPEGSAFVPHRPGHVLQLLDVPLRSNPTAFDLPPLNDFLPSMQPWPSTAGVNYPTGVGAAARGPCRPQAAVPRSIVLEPTVADIQGSTEFAGGGVVGIVAYTGSTVTQTCGVYAWEPQQWSPCSAPCIGEDGVIPTMSRSLQCVRIRGDLAAPDISLGTLAEEFTREVLEDRVCVEAGVRRPNRVSYCNVYSCNPPHWEATDFSECSDTCGAGTQIRDISCKAMNGTVLPLSSCREHASTQGLSTTYEVELPMPRVDTTTPVEFGLGPQPPIIETMFKTKWQYFEVVEPRETVLCEVSTNCVCFSDFDCRDAHNMPYSYCDTNTGKCACLEGYYGADCTQFDVVPIPGCNGRRDKLGKLKN